MEKWGGQKIVLYQIDRVKTNSDDLYGETKPDEIRYKTPIELPCTYKIDKSDNRSYLSSNKNARYRQIGNIEVNLYLTTLEEYKCDVKYGDIIATVINESTIQYFEVDDDGKGEFANANTMFGTVPFWLKVKGCEIDQNVFRG
jgi:hypothetical protein